MRKKAIGRILVTKPSATGHNLVAELPEADFYIRNPDGIPSGCEVGEFEYDPEDQFATFIDAASTKDIKGLSAVNVLRQAFQMAYESGGLGATHDLYNRIQNGWCSQCDTYVLVLDGKECLACGHILTADEVGKTVTKVATAKEKKE